MSQGIRNRLSQQAVSLVGWHLNHLRGAKASTTKLPVELLKVRGTFIVKTTIRSAMRSHTCAGETAQFGSASRPFRRYLPSSHCLLFSSAQDVEGLGESGKLVMVEHGFARNYLLPNLMAVIRRGKQSGSVSGVSTAGTGAATSSSLDSALFKEQEVADEERDLGLIVKKLATTPLVRCNLLKVPLTQPFLSYV
jgi:hypothetical protein